MVILVAAFVGPATRAASPATVQWPTHGWPTASPEAVGLDPAVLRSLDGEIAAGKYGYVDSMLVIRHGRIAFEQHYPHDYRALFVDKGAPWIYNYYDPEWHPFYKGTQLHTMQSVSKSVTSALIGIAIARGEIPDVNVAVMPYFAGFKVASDPRRERMLLWSVLTMTTGIQWDEFTATYTDSRNNCAQMEASQDWIQYVLDQPMAAEPGTTFVYNSGATELLAYILKKTTGRNPDDYAREHLFGPLGIRDFEWKHTPLDLPDTEGGLYLTPRDLAKLGFLFLHGGVWNGRQVVPAAWVEQSTRWSIDTHWHAPGYGFQWWALAGKDGAAPEAYAAIGYGGQYLIVVPRLDLIAVFTGWNIYDSRSLGIDVALERVRAMVVKAAQ
jgi:CubicO group peptidase (beta-lactamase class C family)